MGLADAFGAEDRVQVKFSTFYELVKGCTQRDQMLSGICMICMCVVGGSGDESGADSNIEKEHKPEA